MSTLTTTRVTYTDGTADEITVTMWEQRMAARYMANNDLGTVQSDPITFMGYQAYAKLRQMGRTTLPFDKWLATVIQVEDIHKRNRHDDDDPNPTDDGSQEA